MKVGLLVTGYLRLLCGLSFLGSGPQSTRKKPPNRDPNKQDPETEEGRVGKSRRMIPELRNTSEIPVL